MIPGRLNEQLRNAFYAEKRREYLTLEDTWRSAHDVASEPLWNADVVRRRTARLAELVAKHLQL